MYVSTILKHIFFAIEPGLSAKPSGLHILGNSGYHFSRQRLKSIRCLLLHTVMYKCTNTHADTLFYRQANTAALQKHTHPQL